MRKSIDVLCAIVLNQLKTELMDFTSISSMANSSKGIQLTELKDMSAQLNTTIKTLNVTIARQQVENDNLNLNWNGFCIGSLCIKKHYGITEQLDLLGSLS